MALRCRRVGAVHSIISGHFAKFDGCPLCPRKRTWISTVVMSAKGHFRTHALQQTDPVDHDTVTNCPQPLPSKRRFCVLSLHVCVREHRFELFFERSRRNSELAKSRTAVRGCRVDLHKLNLIARERRVRQDLSEAGEGIPENKGYWHQHRPQSCDTRNGPQQLLV